MWGLTAAPHPVASLQLATVSARENFVFPAEHAPVALFYPLVDTLPYDMVFEAPAQKSKNQAGQGAICIYTTLLNNAHPWMKSLLPLGQEKVLS